MPGDVFQQEEKESHCRKQQHIVSKFKFAAALFEMCHKHLFSSSLLFHSLFPPSLCSRNKRGEKRLLLLSVKSVSLL
jgi:hypothetical protein